MLMDEGGWVASIKVTHFILDSIWPLFYILYQEKQWGGMQFTRKGWREEKKMMGGENEGGFKYEWITLRSANGSS